MRPDPQILLVSVKPRFAEMLIAGSKTVELRRVRPGVAIGSEVLIYASSPRREMVGRARVTDVETASPDDIWEQHSTRVGLARSEFDEYFAGSTNATAISIAEVEGLQPRVPLSELRSRIAGFRPPQSFCYLTPNQAAAVQ